MPEKYLKPLFKFLEKKYADALLQEGNIRIATLHEFRNSNLYQNTTSDENEGKLWISNYYNLYEGNAKNANGLLPLFYPNHGVIRICNGRYAGHIDLPNMHIYCTSMRLFSNSILQATSEDKHACVMIHDREKFFEAISPAISLPLVQNARCVYREKELKARIIEEIDPDFHSETNKYLKNFFSVAFLKPQEYSNHTEFRTIWSNVKHLPYQCTTEFLKNKLDYDHNNQVKAIEKDIAELSNCCLEIDISQLRVNQLFDSNRCMIETRVWHTDGTYSHFRLQRPSEVFAPVIIQDNETKQLGFLSPDNCIDADSIIMSDRNDIAVRSSTIGPILCVSPLNNINKISFISR